MLLDTSFCVTVNCWKLIFWIELSNQFSCSRIEVSSRIFSHSFLMGMFCEMWVNRLKSQNFCYFAPIYNTCFFIMQVGLTQFVLTAVHLLAIIRALANNSFDYLFQTLFRIEVDWPQFLFSSLFNSCAMTFSNAPPPRLSQKKIIIDYEAVSDVSVVFFSFPRKKPQKLGPPKYLKELKNCMSVLTKISWFFKKCLACRILEGNFLP